MSQLILVYDGILPDYFFYSLNFLKKYSNIKIILLITKNNMKIPKNIDCYYIEDFYKKNLSNEINFKNYYKNFWNGFWIKTIERFFILESFCKKYNIKSFFHAEIDNIVFNIDGLNEKLDKFGKKIFFTKDRTDRGLAGLIYINSIDILTDFCNFIINNLKENFFNDMYLLGKFSNLFSEKCGILPNELNAFQEDKILFNSIDVEKVGGVVDGIRIGAFLFGEDPRIIKGFLFNRKQPLGDDNKTNFDYKNLLFFFSSSKKEFLIKHKITKKSVKIFNLHVHSKLFKKLSNDFFFSLILNRANLNKDTLLSFNFKNILFGKIRVLKYFIQKLFNIQSKN